MNSVNYNQIANANPEQLRQTILKAKKIYTGDLDTDRLTVSRSTPNSVGWLNLHH